MPRARHPTRGVRVMIGDLKDVGLVDLHPLREVGLVHQMEGSDRHPTGLEAASVEQRRADRHLGEGEGRQVGAGAPEQEPQRMGRGDTELGHRAPTA